MDKLYLIRYGEIGTKGDNRDKFEAKLIDNIRKSLAKINKTAGFNVYKTYGRIFVETGLPKKRVVPRLQKVCGIVGICPAWRLDLDLTAAKKAVLKSARNRLNETSKEPLQFKISTQRANKEFKLDSMELNNKLGSYLLEKLPSGSLEVELDKPELEIRVEVRSKYIYVYSEDLAGVGGLPVGSIGRVGSLLSGGIDSPVASWKAMKRGAEILPIYFHSFPFTSDRAKEKVVDLARILADYQPDLELRVVDFSELQKEINQACPEDLTTLVMRRLMLEIAERLTKKAGGKGLVTGESLGQVASQTLDALAVTDQTTSLPIFRPLIGLDKLEIESQARELGTYQTSIQPYQDCCTVFVPEHPETHPTSREVKEAEKELEVDNLIKKAVEEVEIIKI